MTLRFASVVTGLLVLGCTGLVEPPPALDSPATWKQYGVAFEYPSNWSASSDLGDQVRTVYVESPGDAIVMVQIYEPGLTIDPDEAIQLALGGMQEFGSDVSGGMLDMGEAQVTPFTRTIAAAERPARRAAFSLSIASIDVPFTLEMYVVEEPAGMTLIMTQSPDEDLDRVRPGFDHLLDSFRRLEQAPASSR